MAQGSGAIHHTCNSWNPKSGTACVLRHDKHTDFFWAFQFPYQSIPLPKWTPSELKVLRQKTVITYMCRHSDPSSFSNSWRSGVLNKQPSVTHVSSWIVLLSQAVPYELKSCHIVVCRSIFSVAVLSFLWVPFYVTGVSKGVSNPEWIVWLYQIKPVRL